MIPFLKFTKCTSSKWKFSRTVADLTSSLASPAFWTFCWHCLSYENSEESISVQVSAPDPASAEVPWEVGGPGWQSGSKRNRDLEFSEEQGTCGQSGCQVGGGEGGGGRREGGRGGESSPAGTVSHLTCGRAPQHRCIVKYDNAGYSDRLSISHLKFTFKDWLFCQEGFLSRMQSLSAEVRGHTENTGKRS